MIAPSHRTIRSSRIKFEIQNLEDLRNNNWKARRQDLMPKTMDQMQWEAEQEQQMINFQTRQNAKEDRQRGGRDNRDGRDGKNFIFNPSFAYCNFLIFKVLTNASNLSKTMTDGLFNRTPSLELNQFNLPKFLFHP
jgi:hypothetical protein